MIRSDYLLGCRLMIVVALTRGAATGWLSGGGDLGATNHQLPGTPNPGLVVLLPVVEAFSPTTTINTGGRAAAKAAVAAANRRITPPKGERPSSSSSSSSPSEPVLTASMFTTTTTTATFDKRPPPPRASPTAATTAPHCAADGVCIMTTTTRRRWWSMGLVTAAVVATGIGSCASSSSVAWGASDLLGVVGIQTGETVVVKGTKDDPLYQACVGKCLYDCTKPKGTEQKSRAECIPDCKQKCATTKAQLMIGTPKSVS